MHFDGTHRDGKILARDNHSGATLLGDDEARILVGIDDDFVSFSLLCDGALLSTLHADNKGYLALGLCSCK
jgi:hypothetical protein